MHPPPLRPRPAPARLPCAAFPLPSSCSRSPSSCRPPPRRRLGARSLLAAPPFACGAPCRALRCARAPCVSAAVARPCLLRSRRAASALACSPAAVAAPCCPRVGCCRVVAVRCSSRRPAAPARPPRRVTRALPSLCDSALGRPVARPLRPYGRGSSFPPVALPTPPRCSCVLSRWLPLLVCFLVLLVVLVRRSWRYSAAPRAWGSRSCRATAGLMPTSPPPVRPACAFLAGALLAASRSGLRARASVAQPRRSAAAWLLWPRLARCCSRRRRRRKRRERRRPFAHRLAQRRRRPDVAMLAVSDAGSPTARPLAPDARRCRTACPHPRRLPARVALVCPHLAGTSGARQPHRAIRFRRHTAAIARYGLGDVEGALDDLHTAQEIDPRHRPSSGCSAIDEG